MTLGSEHTIRADLNKQSQRNPAPKKEQTAELRYGIYLAEVMDNSDANRTGKIVVKIKNHFGKEDVNTYTAMWTSPFVGGTDPKNFENKDNHKYHQAPRSYGMWSPPPDVGNVVLICFADGNLKFPFVLSQTLPGNSMFNQMLPGMPGGQTFEGGEGIQLPTTEKSRVLKSKGDKSGENEHDEGISRPVHHDVAEAITLQGLIKDPIRGVSRSGARRKPVKGDTANYSEVFGILTKGRRDKAGNPLSAGHSFVMDDDVNSNNIRLRTAGGNQILLDDNTGSVYIINKHGTAWFEMNDGGTISVFSEQNLDIRAKGDLNVRADHDINLEAGNDVKIKAVGDYSMDGYMKPDPVTGMANPITSGGQLFLHSGRQTNIFAATSLLGTAGFGGMDLNAASDIKLFSTKGIGMQTPMKISGLSGLGIDLTTSGKALLRGAAGADLMGATVGLNNLTGLASVPDVIPASTAPTLMGSNKRDFKSEQPEYDREGENILPKGGDREKGDKIFTIIPTLVTAEPYEGHTTYTFIDEVQDLMEEDEAAATEEGAEDLVSPGDASFADLVDGEGTKVGKKISEATGAASSALDGAKGKIDEVKGKFDEYKDKLNNMIPPWVKDMQSLLSGEMTIQGLLKALPFTRPPLFNPKLEAMVGYAKKLKDLESLKGMFSLDAFGLPIDLDDLDPAKLEAKIKGVVGDKIAQYTGGIGDDISNLKNEISSNMDEFAQAKGEAEGILNDVKGKVG